jgi:hypothetical protein
MMKKHFLALATLMAAMGGAAAQSQPVPTERVTVTGAREAAIAKFIQSRGAPTRMTGKPARWKAPICPVTYGIPQAYAGFVTRRVRDVAASVGARVDGDENCRGNIQIVFTTSPQALLDNIRTKHSNSLGYHDNTRHAEQMTTLKRPVHAFYSTQTRDDRGNVQTDTPRTTGITVTLPGIPLPSEDPTRSNGPPQFVTLTLPSASAVSVTGTRFLGDGLASEFQHVVMVVDTEKVTALEMGALADHIAMLALSQPSDFDTCQEIPSIANLMIAPACAAAALTTAMSVYDRAYLQGLYKSQVDGAGRVQKAQINYQMKQTQDE